MSMLSSQCCDELRRKAGRLDRASVFLVDCEVLLPEGWPKNAMDNASEAMREAADTIESLRDRLQELQGVTDKSNYTRLFGTPERAARTMHGDTPLCDICELSGKPCDEKGYYGCPLVEDYDALLEWLKGDA